MINRIQYSTILAATICCFVGLLARAGFAQDNRVDPLVAAIDSNAWKNIGERAESCFGVDSQN